jgi:hypothetical protein
MMAGAQSPAIQARPQLKYPILVNAPATIIMKIGIDATARSSMFAIFNLMTASAPHSSAWDCIEYRSRSGRLFEADVAPQA